MDYTKSIWPLGDFTKLPEQPWLRWAVAHRAADVALLIGSNDDLTCHWWDTL